MIVYDVAGTQEIVHLRQIFTFGQKCRFEKNWDIILTQWIKKSIDDADKKILTQDIEFSKLTSMPYKLQNDTCANWKQDIIVGLGRALERKFDPSITGKALFTKLSSPAFLKLHNN